MSADTLEASYIDDATYDHHAANHQGNVASRYQGLRTKYQQFFSLTHDQLKLASDQETASLRQWVDSVGQKLSTGSAEVAERELGYLEDFYDERITKMTEFALNLWHSEFMPPLRDALAAGIISKQSFDEWVAWMQDTNRNYKEKEASVRSTLPKYLDDRYQLAEQRRVLLGDSRLSELEKTADPALRERIRTLGDDHLFLNILDLGGRQKLVQDIVVALPILAQEKELFAKFEAELKKAKDGKLIHGSSYDKWVARFKDPRITFTAKQYFVTHQFPSYVSAWERIKSQRDTLLQHPSLEKLDGEAIPDLKTFLDEDKFLKLHYDKKLDVLAKIKAGITAHEKGQMALHTEANTVLTSAAAAGYIPHEKVGPWLEHVMSGKRSLKEMKQFVKDWAKVRYRFDGVEQQMNRGKAPQGFRRLTPEKFLMLSYKQRLSYVEEAERRLNVEKDQQSNNPMMRNLKGKVRHALDAEQWDEARMFLGQAWAIATTEEDRRELESMERYLKAMGGSSSSNVDAGSEEVTKAFAEINQILELLPTNVRRMYEKALQKGPDTLWCITTCVYNRTWCSDHGYLNPAFEDELRQRSTAETAHRLRPSNFNNPNSINNNDVDGYHQAPIHDSPSKPQNEFIGSNGIDAFVEKAHQNRNNFNFWYWTNAIIDDVSIDQNNSITRNLNWRLKRAAYTLHRHGFRWAPYGPPIGLN